MSKKDYDTEKEPWEQPIYDTEHSAKSSRTEQRQNNKGSRWFGITLIFLMLAAIAVPLTFYFTAMREKNKETADTSSESTSISQTLESSTKTKESSTSASVEEPTTPSSSVAEPETPVAEPEKEETTPSSSTPAVSSGSSYTVQSGDNLYRIALNHGMTTDELAALNGLSADSTIQVGTVLKVK